MNSNLPLPFSTIKQRPIEITKRDEERTALTIVVEIAPNRVSEADNDREGLQFVDNEKVAVNEDREDEWTGGVEYQVEGVCENIIEGK